MTTTNDDQQTPPLCGLEPETLSLFPEEPPSPASASTLSASASTPPVSEPPAPEPAPPQPEPETPTPLGALGLTPEERAKIQALGSQRLGTRAIAAAVSRDRKTVRRVLREVELLAAPTPAEAAAPSPTPPDAAARASLLDPYREEIKDRVAKGLTTTRILRELRELGYRGGRTVLGDFVREVRAPLAPRRKVTRRFETPPGEEAQADWSTYRVELGGRTSVIQVLAVVLACSRKAFFWATDSQKLARLLEGLELAFASFQGVALRVVFDNMAVVTLGRVGPERRPIWNPGFVPFHEHYGFEPVVCRIAHPDRKGEVEAALGHFERDCLRGLAPASLAELNRLIRRWTDEVANRRVHGTTGLVPDEAWAAERPFLIPLPERRFPGACHEETRRVAEDCTVSICGTTYTVPARLAHRQVRVRLYTERFEVLDKDGSIALGRAYVAPAEKGRLVLDPAHYADLPRTRDRKGGKTRALEEQLLVRWPALADCLAGLKLRNKSLVHVHLRRLVALGERFGDTALVEAALRAHAAGLHTSQAIERILEHDFPEREDVALDLPAGAEARVLALIEDVEAGTLDDYAALDELEAQQRDDDDAQGEEVLRGA